MTAQEWPKYLSGTQSPFKFLVSSLAKSFYESPKQILAICDHGPFNDFGSQPKIHHDICFMVWFIFSPVLKIFLTLGLLLVI